MDIVVSCSVSVPGYAGSLSSALPSGGAAAWERLGAEMVLSALVASAYFAAMELRWTGSAPLLLGTAYCAASFVSVSVINRYRLFPLLGGGGADGSG